MKEPCIELKCICYPICRNKRSIDCDDVKDYYQHLENQRKSIPKRSLWKIISKIFPNMEHLNLHDKMIVKRRGSIYIISIDKYISESVIKDEI